MSEKNAPLIHCNQCDGTGRHPLGEDMWATLRTVRRLRSAHALQVAAAMKWRGNATAINNRLKYLMKLGFLARVRNGKYLYYSPVKQPPHSHAQPEQHP